MNRGFRLLLLAGWMVVLGFRVGAAPAPEEDSATTDEKLLQGQWTLVAYEFDGKVEDRTKEGITIKDRTMTAEGEEETITFTFDARKKPREITFTLKGTTPMQGIYKVDKDSLTLCFDRGGIKKMRPTEFSSKGGFSLATFKRAKP